jgi:hypothetical protein
MFSGQFNMEPDEDGEYFIDRNPKYFEIILDFLRKGNVILHGMSQSELEELVEELHFYRLEELIGAIKKQDENVRST